MNGYIQFGRLKILRTYLKSNLISDVLGNLGVLLKYLIDSPNQSREIYNVNDSYNYSSLPLILFVFKIS